MRKLWILGILCAFFLSAIGTAHAADVALFANTAYVGYSPGASGDEASNVEATLISQGHTVTTFTGITATDFNNAVAGQDVLAIPELENGDLNTDLDAAARTAIADFVNSGGVFIGFYPEPDSLSLVNDIFGFSLSAGANDNPYALNAAGAAGTPFEGGPASIPYNNATTDISGGSLPPSTNIIYNSGTNVAVFMAPYGSGWVIFLGWDWFNAAPGGPNDEGWLDVLDSAVNVSSQQTAIPTVNEWGMIIFTFLLAGSALWIMRRKSMAS